MKMDIKVSHTKIFLSRLLMRANSCTKEREKILSGVGRFFLEAHKIQPLERGLHYYNTKCRC